MKAWLKGGLIGTIISLFLLYFWFRWALLILLFSYGCLDSDKFLCKISFYIYYFIFIVIFFIVGSLIGHFIGKRKSKKQQPIQTQPQVQTK